jgi:hypothetical protein
MLYMGSNKHHVLDLIDLVNFLYHMVSFVVWLILLLVFHSAKGLIVLLLYIDDIFLTRSSTELVTFFIQILNHEFSMKYLGSVHHFLGVEISTTIDGLHLSQSHYVLTILEWSNMLHCKPMSTPLEVKFKIDADITSIVDPSWCSLIPHSHVTKFILQHQLCFAIHAQFYSCSFEIGLANSSISKTNN